MKKTKKTLRVLQIEDSEPDAATIIRALSDGGYEVFTERVENAEAMRAALGAEVWDVILCDYSLPDFDALSALALLKSSGLDIPFIVISGTSGEETVVSAMVAGASDYLMKNQLIRIVPAIERELVQAVNRREKKQAEEDRRRCDDRYRALFEYAPDGIIISSPEDYYLDANASMCQMLGYEHKELIGMHASDIVIRSEARELDSEFALVQSTPDYNREWHFRRKDGSVFAGEVIASIMPDGNLLAMIRDITDRKAAEQQLQLHSVLLNSIGQAVIVTDAVGTITYWNRFAEKMYGWPSSEALGRNIVDVTPTQATRAQGIEILEALKSGERWSGEFIVQDRKGKSFPIFVTNTPLLDGNGKVESIIGISLDVTERKLAQEKLRENESLLSSTQRIAHIGSWVIELSDAGTVETAKESWSDEHYRIFGFEPGEVEATDEVFYNSVHPDDRKRLANTIREAIEQKTPFDIEHRIILPDGRERIVHAMSELVLDHKTGKPLKLLGSVQDITERKQAEAARFEREQEFEALVENAPDIISRYDRKFRHLYVNRVVEQATGLPASAFIGKTHKEMGMPHHLLAEWQAVLKDVFSSGREREIEFEFPTPDGPRFYDSRLVPEHAPDGSIRSVLNIARDITERKRAEAELRKSREHMERAQRVAKLGSWESDLSTWDVTWSEEMYRIFEMDVDSFKPTHQGVLLLVHPEDSAALDKAFVDSVAQHSSCSIGHRILMPDGRIKFIRARWEIVLDADDVPVTAVGTCQDITARTLAEASKQESEERLRLLFEQMKDGFYYSTPDGRLLDINPAMIEMFGYSSREEMLKVDVTRDLYFSAEDRKDQSRDDGEIESDVYRMRRKDGSAIWVEDRGQYKYDEEGNIEFHQGILRDVTERKLAEERLIQSEERYRDLVENAYEMIYTRDLDGNIISINAAGENLTGYTREEFLQLNMGQIVAPEDWERVKAIIAGKLSGMEGTADEMDILAKDGRRITIEVNRTLLYQAGFPVGVQVIARDITERKRIENQLIESESHKRAILESALDCIIAIDSEGLVTEFNPAAETVFGYSRADAIGKELAELIIPPAMRDQHRRGLQHYLATGEGPLIGKRTEISAMRSDGSEFPIELAINAIELSGTTVFTAYLRDISERKLAEESFIQSEQRYRDLVENAHDIIYSHDLEGNYTSINAAGEQITGYTREESLKMNLVDTVAPGQLEKAKEMIGRKLKGEEITSYELDIVAKDGRTITVEVNTKLVFRDGVAIGIQGIARDVTERKSLEDQLAQAQKLESLGRLTGGIAHDFNNMLTVINGFSDLSLRQVAADDPARHNIGEIKKAGERAAMLTNQLLAFSRSQVLQPEVIVINDIINDTTNMLKRVIGEGIELVAILKDTLGRVKVDPGQLSQIVLNLAVNARDAMPKGGMLTIETANIFLDPDYARQHLGVLPGSYVVLSVSDTGTGMTAELQEKIFDPFFTTKMLGQGTGLGLATVYGIVKQSGGGIFVYSEVGHGTTFNIYLPRVMEKSDTIQADTDRKTGFPTGSETILLVEDEDLVRALSRQILETCGYTVIEARDGIEAIEIMKKTEIDIDLLFTDVVMARMGGRELAEKLLAEMPDLPVLFASGYTDDAIIRHGVLETNVNFIQKPFSPGELARTLRDLLDAKK